MKQVHVLTIQGHPEFNESIVTGITDQMLEERVIDHSILSKDFRKQDKNADADTDTEPRTEEDTEKRWKSSYDGATIVGNAFWRTLGVDYGKTLPNIDRKPRWDRYPIPKVVSDTRG